MKIWSTCCRRSKKKGSVVTIWLHQTPFSEHCEKIELLNEISVCSLYSSEIPSTVINFKKFLSL